jgi:hypothetical protein
MKRLLIGRTIARVIAVVFIAAGLFFLYGSYDLCTVFYEQFEDRQLDIEADLSQPGKSTGILHQTTWPCMGQFFFIHLPEDAVAGKPPASLIESLEFTYTLTDSEGEEIARGSHDDMPHWNKENEPESHAIPIAHARGIGPGDYTFSLTVLKGAQQLAGLKQRLVCKVNPCSMELYGAVVVAFISLAAFAMGAVILFRIRARRGS